jgi:hypothetical protein
MNKPKKLSDLINIEPKNKKGDIIKPTEPIKYPMYRSQKGKVSIPSETNVEISKDWTEYNKL